MQNSPIRWNKMLLNLLIGSKKNSCENYNSVIRKKFNSSVDRWEKEKKFSVDLFKILWNWSIGRRKKLQNSSVKREKKKSWNYSVGCRKSWNSSITHRGKKILKFVSQPRENRKIQSIAGKYHKILLIKVKQNSSKYFCFEQGTTVPFLKIVCLFLKISA